MKEMKRFTLDCSNLEFINFLKIELDDNLKLIFYYES